MPSFPKPNFTHQVDLKKEINAIKKYRDSKPEIKIPQSTSKNLLLATWNIANLGAQDREPEHLKIIAQIISWFDLIAIQEIKENSLDFREIVKLLGTGYQFVFSDASGNNERMAFVFKKSKVKLREEIAELAIPPADFRYINLPGIDTKFEGFDRSPYLASFSVNNFDFSLLNVHLYFGSDSEKTSINRRCLEAYCVGRWADLRSKSKYSFNSDSLALGDFNLPMIDEKDPVYKALVNRGIQLPEHSSKIYSNINDDKAYDQIAFLPGMKSKILNHGIFPFDNAVFADIYNNKTAGEFRGYIRYYLSDHRPMWMELNISDEV